MGEPEIPPTVEDARFVRAHVNSTVCDFVLFAAPEDENYPNFSYGGIGETICKRKFSDPVAETICG
jgi:hypothetical protein